jgi:hypothetical protein
VTIAGANELLAGCQDLSGRWRERDAAIIAAMSRPAAQQDGAQIAASRKQLAETENRLAAIETQLERKFPDYAALASPKPLKADEVQQLLGGDEALVFGVSDTELGPTHEEKPSHRSLLRCRSSQRRPMMACSPQVRWHNSSSTRIGWCSPLVTQSPATSPARKHYRGSPARSFMPALGHCLYRIGLPAGLEGWPVWRL